jgi:hypothetical protein
VRAKPNRPKPEWQLWLLSLWDSLLHFLAYIVLLTPYEGLGGASAASANGPLLSSLNQDYLGFKSAVKRFSAAPLPASPLALIIHQISCGFCNIPCRDADDIDSARFLGSQSAERREFVLPKDV